MKTLLNRIYLFILLVATLSLVAPGCSGGNQIPEPVCNYGSLFCTTASYLCNTIPGIPEIYCSYLNVACNTLEELCQLEPGSPEFEEALKKLEDNNQKWHDQLVSSGVIKKE